MSQFTMCWTVLALVSAKANALNTDKQGRMHTPGHPGHGPGFGPNFFHFTVVSTSGLGSIAEEGFGSIAEEE